MTKVKTMGEKTDKLRDAIPAELLDATKASRTTLSLDDPKRGFDVDDVAGGAVAPGKNSLRGVTSIDQRVTTTAQWAERNRRILVHDNLSQGEPRAPEALVRRAQMLAPIEREGRLDSWNSVHEARDTRHWTTEEQDAVLNAAQQVPHALA